ncbi:hypothetical protein JQ599_31975 [Bradyrhizobium diazoefficiens]|nr:hypothetical protein [Bradyrhizobium diazoefficiens]MBR0704561.1 hypothetical protein [Bradyrhizobium diazoefficiens]MBR0773129.1 hypothetical protein [Bradyrhizobium diazoefficiens]
MSQEWYEEEEEDLVEIYKVWCKMPFWTAFESSALIHKCDPSEPIEIRSAQRVVKRTSTLIERHCGTALLPGSPDRISPPALLYWAKRMGVRINYPLKTCIRRSYPAAPKRADSELGREALVLRVAELQAQVEQLTEDPPQNSNERRSLLKIVLGLSVAGWGYDPRAERNPSTGEMIGDMRTVGVPMVDQGTLKKWIDEAAEELDWPLPEEEGNGQPNVSLARRPSRKRPPAGR